MRENSDEASLMDEGIDKQHSIIEVQYGKFSKEASRRVQDHENPAKKYEEIHRYDSSQKKVP